MKRYRVCFLCGLFCLLAACGEKEPLEFGPVIQTPEATMPAFFQLDGVTYVSIETALGNADIQAEWRDHQLLLTEKGLEVILDPAQPYLYRRGYVVAVLSVNPVLQNDTIYLPETLCEELFGDGTLFNDILFFKDEITAALDSPEVEPGKSILSIVEKPRSMGISTPNLDFNRIFRETPLSEYPAELAEELSEMGVEDPQSYTYSEYLVLTESRSVEDAGLRKYFLAYKELQNEDPSAWTVRQYTDWEQSRTIAEKESSLTEEQRAFLEEKDIRIEDLHWLQKDFYDSYTERSDEELREVIEAYYQFRLSMVTDS